VSVVYSRRTAMLLAAMSAAAATLNATTGRADDYPSHTVRVIVPFGAGGPTDVYSRDIALELQKSLGQTFYMDNRPGAGTTLGTDMAQAPRSAPIWRRRRRLTVIRC
jgi:tripartite-type tricarboxylate transporter receptor subunit TctC